MADCKKYKNSGIKWLGKIPDHWEIKRISTEFSENKNTNIDYVESKALQFKYGEIIEKPQREIDSELIETYQKYIIVEPNDIIINGLNLNYDYVTQRIGIVRQKGIITSAYITLRPSKNINPLYYCYLFKSMDDLKLLNGMGIGIRLTLSYNELKQIKIPFPTIREQDQIVDFLKGKCQIIDNVIDRKKKAIGLLIERKQTITEGSIMCNSHDLI